MSEKPDPKDSDRRKTENEREDEKQPADRREHPARSPDEDSEGKISEKEEKEARSH